MVHKLVLEALYPEMEEATIGRWLAAVGDVIITEQPLAELITDKVAYEYLSPQAGTLLAILPREKSVVPVGAVLALLGGPEDRVTNLEEIEAENRRLAAAREAELQAVHEATGAAPAAAPAAPPGRAVRATPAARRLARERGIDLATITGSGPEGMITVEDISTA